MPRYWVYTIGLQDQAPPSEWVVEWGHHRTEMWFPRTKRPASIARGDYAVIYGSQAKGFLAAVKVVGEGPEPNPDPDGHRRFPYLLRHQLLVAKLADEHVASPHSAGISVQRIQRGPHTEISRDEYRSAVATLLRAARLTAAA